jgi:hypothetical protein
MFRIAADQPATRGRLRISDPLRDLLDRQALIAALMRRKK